MRPKPERVHFLKWCLILITMMVGLSFANGQVDRVLRSEYELKAGWLVNFLKFVEWRDNSALEGDSMVIGILGKDPFGANFTPVNGITVAGKELVIKRYGRFDNNLSEFDCQLLFIAWSERKKINQILELTRNTDILVVSEVDGFLDRGGMINFLFDNNLVKYEVNQLAADRGGLRISAQILARAHRVIRK